jgi:acetylornithine deacetylase
METLTLYQDAVKLLRQLIATPSFSKEEDKTADIIAGFLQQRNIAFDRHLNNIFSTNKYYDASKPTLLLNSHHDTVKPNHQYTKDPFKAIEEDGKLFGLGSNDAGGPLVSLIATYIHFYEKQGITYNIYLAASAE